MGMHGVQVVTGERVGRRDPGPSVAGGPLGQGDPAATGPRVLLLTGVLLVTVFSGGNGNVAASLVALVIAAAATACALVRPGVVPAGERAARAERVLVGTLVGAGVALTAARLVPGILGGTPLPAVAAAGAAVVGLAAAARTRLRVSRGTVVFGLVLGLWAVLAVALLRSSPANIDVEVYLREGSRALARGSNPYTISVPNIYPPDVAAQVYGPGMVVDGRVEWGFVYPPLPLLVAFPAYLLGDVRYGQLVAMVVTAVALWHLAVARIGRTAAVLAVAAVPAVPLLTLAFTEPVSAALLAGGVLALTRRRLVLGAVLLALLLVSKQYFVVVLPLVALLRPWLTRRSVIAGLAAAAVVTLPFVLVDPAAFAEAVTGVQAAPLRPDSVSLLVAAVGAFSWPPPGTYAVLPVVVGLLTALVLARYAPRTPAAFAAAVGLTLLVTILLSKQAFANYYFMASSALLVAAVAWPDPGTAEPTAP